jgi:DNA-binding NtrC family response regulator
MIVKNAAFFCETDTIGPDDVNFGSESEGEGIWERTKSMPLSESKECFEKELIERRMRSMGYDLSRVAESLGMVRNNLYRKLNYYSIRYKNSGA